MMCAKAEDTKVIKIVDKLESNKNSEGYTCGKQRCAAFGM